MAIPNITPSTLTVESIPATADTDQGWSRNTLIAFRFTFILTMYVTLSWFPLERLLLDGGESAIPFLPWLAAVYLFPLHVGRELVGLITNPVHCGVLDCYPYEALGEILMAAVGAAIWTLLDRKSRHYRRLHAIMRVVVRYSLFSAMWYYAWDKFVGFQFRVNRLGSDLVLPFALWEPHEMMWSTMGLSTIYATFTGLGEMAGGFLMLSRRTTTIGALIVIQIMAVIAILDILAVPGTIVLHAYHFLIMSLVLLAPDARRMISFYVQNRRVPKAKPEVPLVIGYWRWLRVPIILYCLIEVVHRTPPNSVPYWFAPHRLSGLFAVVPSSNAPPKPLFDSTRWKYVDLNDLTGTYRGSYHLPTEIRIVRADETRERRSLTVDTVRQLMIASVPDKKTVVDTLSYVLLADGGLHLKGRWSGMSVDLDTRIWQPEETELYRRGYAPSNPRWLSKLPAFTPAKFERPESSQ